MSIREVFPGSTANPEQDYVELQMYAAGQNFVGGHTLDVYDATGAVVHTTTFPSRPLPSGANQQTILAGAAASVVGVTPDYVDAGLTAIDPDRRSSVLERLSRVVHRLRLVGQLHGQRIAARAPQGRLLRQAASPTARRCAGRLRRAARRFLEAGDDSDSSATDFSLVARCRATTPTTPIEVPCPNTSIDKGPSGKTTDRTPTFKFSSADAPPATFECRLDSGRLRRLHVARHAAQAGASASTPSRCEP